MLPAEFVASVSKGAQLAMVSSGVPASVAIAQAILESNWGKSALATTGFNLFGIKANSAWKGETLDLPTREFVNGVWVTVSAHWRKYKSWDDSIVDHSNFLRSNPRYAKCFLTKDPETFVKAMWAAGYATDPTYPAKIMAIIAGRNLTYYDKT